MKTFKQFQEEMIVEKTDVLGSLVTNRAVIRWFYDKVYKDLAMALSKDNKRSFDKAYQVAVEKKGASSVDNFKSAMGWELLYADDSKLKKIILKYELLPRKVVNDW